MDDIFFYAILFLLVIIVANQNRERQERETKDMTKKQKDRYFQDIKDKQKENWKTTKTILIWIGAIILTIIGIIIIYVLKN